MELEELKKDYGKLKSKYSLPSFKELNEDFDIEKIDRESETLLRAIRKTIMERVYSFMSFVEMLMNPMNAPRMYHSYLKSITLKDKKEIEEVYAMMGKMSVDSLIGEIEYSEKVEAGLIKEIFGEWKKIKPKLKGIFKGIKNPSVNNERKERGYFG